MIKKLKPTEDLIAGYEWDEKNNKVVGFNLGNGGVRVVCARGLKSRDVFGIKSTDIKKGKINGIIVPYRDKNRIITAFDLTPQAAESLYLILKKKFDK